MTTLPTITNRTYFPAHVMNTYSQELLELFDWATSPNMPFECLTTQSGGNWGATGDPIWSGYMLYTGDTDTFHIRYRQWTGGVGATTVEVNGVVAHTNSTGNALVDTTVDISGQSLTAGRVYSVTFHNSSGVSDPRWAGMQKAITYTALPTFTNGVTMTAAQINTLRTNMVAMQGAKDAPHAPNSNAKLGSTGPGGGVDLDGTAQVVWRGYFHNRHDNLTYKLKCGISVKSFISTIYYNGYTLNTTTQTGFSVDVENTRAITDHFSPTRGQMYPCYVELSRSGTSNVTKGFCHSKYLYESSDTTCTPPNYWAHGDTDIGKTHMDKYGAVIDLIHSGAASPDAPLYFEHPAVKTNSSTEWRIDHRRPWLRYRGVTGDNVKLKYGPNFGTRVNLTNDGGNQSYNLQQIQNLVVGQWYIVEGVEYAQEADDEQP